MVLAEVDCRACSVYWLIEVVKLTSKAVFVVCLLLVQILIHVHHALCPEACLLCTERRRIGDVPSKTMEPALWKWDKGYFEGRGRGILACDWRLLARLLEDNCLLVL